MKRFYILLVFITLGMMANAQSFQVKVVKISDGDTFTAINRDNLQIKLEYTVLMLLKRSRLLEQSLESICLHLFLARLLL